ncbi:OmpA family protein [Luteibacter sp. SG786]|uniref:OmpA family protein n=1 Tax=Luteibacter sp. SG786 TaxID=2587130 RepID=UPI00141E01FB|nr:OmpA family protein [Luteibacter sp. SG786]NII55035.1 peptidoglycan-associated lipoprotein [Luteibacter sp. SG786]
MRCHRRVLVISSCLLAVALTACHGYVKKADFDSTVAELRANDQKQQQEIDGLTEQMRQRFADYDAKIAAMKGRIRVDAASHFAFNDSTLREEDKPLLDDFAKVVSGNFPEAVITVEGFADPAGSTAFNRRLGQARADAVRDYLVSTGGLSADKVRAVSYGEARNRQVLPGQSGEGGEPNRRVTLVIDYAGAMAGASGG